jgi:hypothetical protein
MARSEEIADLRRRLASLEAGERKRVVAQRVAAPPDSTTFERPSGATAAIDPEDPHSVVRYISPAANSVTVGEAESSIGAGVYGSNTLGVGVWGVSYSNHAGVFGESSHGVGIRGKGHLAGLFEGNVEIRGNIQLGGGCCM